MVPQYFRLLGDLASYSDPFGPSSCSYFYNKLSHAVLKGRDFLGRPVILARQGKMLFTISHFIHQMERVIFIFTELVAPTEFEHAFCSVFFLIDYLNMISVDTQRLGVVVICDWQGYSFQHLRNTKPAHFRISAQMFQDSFPARFKAIHFVRNPYLVSCMYAIAKPLLREKIRNRVHFHGHNLEALHQHVSVDILPEFLGGKLPADGYADIEITSGVVDGDNYYSGKYTLSEFIIIKKSERKIKIILVLSFLEILRQQSEPRERKQ